MKARCQHSQNQVESVVYDKRMIFKKRRLRLPDSFTRPHLGGPVQAAPLFSFTMAPLFLSVRNLDVPDVISETAALWLYHNRPGSGSNKGHKAVRPLSVAPKDGPRSTERWIHHHLMPNMTFLRVIKGQLRVCGN